MSEKNRKETFKDFAKKKCSGIICNISDEQLEKIVLAYERGYIDALKMLEEENIIKAVKIT